MDRKMVELLAPAGTYECFTAAMNAGADAVYLGLDRFSARAGAGNFTEDELLRALDTAHILGRKIYLTLNTLLRDDEIGKLYEMLKMPYEHGLDGIIVQDIGVMSYIHSTFPYLPIHASTQAAITTAEGAAFLAPLGVKRIVPARELSLSEIKLLKEKSGLEIECFIHGSLCYSYSGKCLMSSLIGGRSGNRGRCAQPCRLMYNDTYPLSLKDLCTIDILPGLIDAGISSFKIEGRMKSSDYVYGVTSMYRKYIDSIYTTGKYRVGDDDRQKLISYYTRSGNCEGFYQTHNSRDMITYDSPSYISSSDDEEVEECPAKVPVMIRCVIRKDQPVIITLSANDETVTVTTKVIPEVARNAAINAASVEKQLKKTGNTLFTVKRSEIDIDDGLFIPNGLLNEIRRRGLDALSERILAPYLRESAEEMTQRSVTVSTASCRDHNEEEYPEVRAGVLEISQAEAVLHSAADSIILPMALFDTVYERFADDLLKHDIYIRLPYVVRDESYKNSCSSIASFITFSTKKCDIKGFYVSDAAEVVLLRNCGFTGSVMADIHMYAYNNAAYDLLIKCGITKTTVPTELNLAQLRDRGIKGEELIIYGRSPMMISANCAYNTLKGCGRPEDAAYFNSIRLDDRKGEQFYVFCDCTTCTNTIYNCVPLLLADHDEAFKVTAPSSLRFEFTDETGPQVSGILDKYYDSRTSGGCCTKKLTDRFTRGHIKRGVE